MAALMSVTALAIDALLPALDVIGLDLGVVLQADNQLLITMNFFGIRFGSFTVWPLI